MTRPMTRTLTLAVALLIASPAWAAEPSERFSLARAVPAESWLYVHGAHNPERDFIDKHWSHVFATLKTSGIDKDVKTFLESTFKTPEEKDKFTARWDKFVLLTQQVQWCDLAAHEAVYFQHSLKDHNLLLRPSTETLDANTKALVALFDEVGALLESPVEHAARNKAEVWTLKVGDSGFSFNLFRHGQILGLSDNAEIMTQTIALLAGDASPAKTLVDSTRYRSAVSDLPAPEDSVTFLDMRGLWSGMKQIIKTSITADDPAQEQKVEQVWTNVVDQLDFLDYVAVVEQTEGLRTRCNTVVKLADGARTRKLCTALADRKPIAAVLDRIPQDASGYRAGAGADFATIYSLVKDFVEKNFDEGPKWLAQWGQWQQENGFNLQDDVLSWIDGQYLVVTLPPAIQTGMGGGDGVLMLKVRDGAKALDTINKHLDRYKEAVMIAPAADVKAEGFRSVTHPMMMMFGMLGGITYGVDGEWLYVTNSTAALNKCLARAKGQGASIAANERFQKEGLAPKGAVTGASFTDTTNWGPQLAMGLGMGMPMAAMMIPQTEETAPVRSVFSMMGKLAPALAQINFELSTSTVSTFQNDRWLSETVNNYKDYTERPLETAKPGEHKKKETKLDGM